MNFRSSFAHRDALRGAALDEFCDRGYDAASINRILTNAGMSKGQLYHHFANKQALYLGLVEWMIDEKQQWLPTHLPEGDDDFFAVLRNQILAAVAFAVDHPDADRLTRALLRERDRPIFEAVSARFGFTSGGPLDRLVEAHHREGAFHDNVSADFITRLLALVLNQAPALLDLSDASDMERAVDELITALGDGLRAP
ncbi:MAG: TetR/AcrR family transcriptional regulator [Acidimicrobiia bacterium]